MTRISEMKEFYLKMRSSIIEFDRSISLVITADMIETILAIMLSVWSYALLRDHNAIRRMGHWFCTDAVIATTKLIIDCLINCLLYDESDRVMAALDDFSDRDLNDRQFRELLLFKSISRKTRFGFTIEGFAPLRKTILIPVI